ncbi:MAG: bile acid:sodium symporter family protein [Deltaproteobacteria bacterium]|jgi:bile acid:Na+ symporter, BASS family|nr:bile acid:sodium symporter family protein [Deltaproteobacteria bacterium]MBT4268994.1 bile acid:sodium symporter family protein [Deltaproteobacteria bacterium]MBT4637960.1 bile acid:sodium symporter family protein [Deltaproteobacteria bacterium]MBT6616491.1 bile acid:sodium symporter family protein [Deltaproteobacteria bacterium]MBT7155776.1 bile acid:sodium symporter family protein [Deltaproteobacteria bacterium]
MQAMFLINVIVPLCMAVIMFGMGLSLLVEDFKRILIYPKAVAIGVFGQIILLPAVGYLIASIFSLSPEQSVGLMVLTACAGGATSNMIVHLAKGDVALSVTLTSISCVITIITIPFVVNFALFHFMDVSEAAALPIGITNMKLFFLILFPLLLGLLVHIRYPAVASRLERHVNWFSVVFFVVLVVSIVSQNLDILAVALPSVGPATFTLSAVTMTIGYILSRIFRLNIRQSTAISIEIGVQNSATGIFIATVLLESTEIALTPSVYSLIMYVNAGILIMMMGRRARTEEEQAVV